MHVIVGILDPENNKYTDDLLGVNRGSMCLCGRVWAQRMHVDVLPHLHGCLCALQASTDSQHTVIALRPNARILDLRAPVPQSAFPPGKCLVWYVVLFDAIWCWS